MPEKPSGRPSHETQPRVRLGFAASAHDQFEKIPRHIREGLTRKLKDVALNPKIAKPLTGKLNGHFRVTYGRLRCVVRLTNEAPVLLVLVVAPRREGARDDAYQQALDALRADPPSEKLFAAHVRAYLEEQRLAAFRRRNKE